MSEEVNKKRKEKKCEHEFIFQHWEAVNHVGGTNYESRAVVVCKKCGEVRIKKPNHD